MDRLQAQDEARKDKLAVNKEEQEVNDYRRDINAAHQQQQKERNNRYSVSISFSWLIDY